MQTFQIYPLDGQPFSVELSSFRIDGETFTVYGGTGDAMTTLLTDEHIAAIYCRNEPPTDPNLGEDQPRLFKVYLRNHIASPLEIYAHYFKTLPAILEFHYKKVAFASAAGGLKLPISRDEKVDGIYIKRSEVVAVVSLEPLPNPDMS